MNKRVKVSLVFYYDPETYLFDYGDTDEHNPPKDEEIFRRCREMFIEDITDLQNPIPYDVPKAEFIEDDDPEFPHLITIKVVKNG